MRRMRLLVKRQSGRSFPARRDAEVRQQRVARGGEDLRAEVGVRDGAGQGHRARHARQQIARGIVPDGVIRAGQQRSEAVDIVC